MIDFGAVAAATDGAINGCMAITKYQAKLLRKGNTYINVHSVNFGGGEIRGQLVPVKGITYKAAGP